MVNLTGIAMLPQNCATYSIMNSWGSLQRLLQSPIFSTAIFLTSLAIMYRYYAPGIIISIIIPAKQQGLKKKFLTLGDYLFLKDIHTSKMTGYHNFKTR